jgi:ubiquinone/menaquinone biosynthesis C-methylase UbiE
MADATYIHGTDPDEQARLAALGELTDAAFVDFVQLNAHDRVLDVGSGLGNLARRVAQRVPQGKVWGIERSAEQLARARCDDLPNLLFQQADAHAIPFDDGVFDIVYCRYLLEHVTEPVRVLREMHRILKPGGRAFVQENNILINTFDPDCPRFDHVWRQFAQLQTLLGGDASIGKKLFRLFREAGFARVELSIQSEVHHHGTPAFRPWVENLIHNVKPVAEQLVAHGLATADEIRRGVEELQCLVENPAATALFYWNRAIGLKKSSRSD